MTLSTAASLTLASSCFAEVAASAYIAIDGEPAHPMRSWCFRNPASRLAASASVFACISSGLPMETMSSTDVPVEASKTR
jgi:hypothetical protein